MRPSRNHEVGKVERLAAPPAQEPGVGYGRPPIATRFKKGQSGNPKGRPARSKNFSTLIEQALDETVEVVVDGRRRRLTKREVAVRRIVDGAAKGDPKAIATLLKIAAAQEDRRTDPRKAEQPSEIDDKAADEIVRSFLASFAEGEG